MKKLLLFIVIMIGSFTLMACNATDNGNDRPRVQATLFPQYDMARALAGDYIDLEFVAPPGVSPHNYEPGARKVIDILESDLLLYTGDLMEPWVSRLIDSESSNTNLKMVDLSKNITLTDEDAGIDDSHDHEEYDEIGAFELLDRGDDDNRLAYVHGNHWHGSLSNLEVGGRLSLGAYIESEDGTVRELDGEGEHNGFEVSLYKDSEEGIVDLANHGDHVHINGVNEGTAQVVFTWMHDGNPAYTTPPIDVLVGEASADDDDETDQVEVFEILNRGNDEAKVAYVHGDHWHGGLPNVEIDGRVSLGAYIETTGGRERELDGDGSHNGLEVSLYEDSEEGIVELVNHGDHVHINGVSEGTAQVVFTWTHNGEERFTTPPIDVSVVEELDDDHDQGFLDPHFWLDPLNAQQMVMDVRDALVELLPEHEDEINANADAYMDDLEELHNDMLYVRENVEHTVVMHGGHNAFNYFMRRYDIEYLTPYRGYSTDAEPTPGAIQEMIDNMERFGVNHLFSEKLVSESVANTISEQTGAEILYIYDGENAPVDEFREGITFIDMMKHNIEQYKIGLNYSE